ncbi:hypothetical protein DM01DRAFT_1408421 [Hesseltinella vesiculosa]|uniref:Zn(2)-C6 fungal-type domain-containing protein n=1 Tax=Hesseltinella vesiculosa TaxID=101127 RepID=A0A1X2GEF3_9FUNG|nr:hypothetical protein DM01DRAFT_1408421 [Hesseltinella vesiculosa]
MTSSCSQPLTHTPSVQRKKSNKPHVRTACSNCKKAHLACDTARPCKRCISVGKSDSCYDIQHKKRGRPKLRPPFATNSLTSLPSLTAPSAVPAYYYPYPASSAPSTVHGMPHSLTSASAMAMPAPIRLTKPTGPALPVLAPFLPPSPPSPCFEMTKSQRVGSTSTKGPTMLTIFLTLELLCGRASDECMELLGYHPRDLAYQPLEQFLMNPSDLRQVQQKLMASYRHHVSASPAITSPASTVSSADHFHTAPTTLLEIANGSSTFKTRLAFKPAKDRHGDASGAVMDAHLYFGGGLGADLCSLTNLDRLYIVCTLTLSKTSTPHPQPQRPVGVPLIPPDQPARSLTVPSMANYFAFPEADPTLLLPNNTSNTVPIHLASSLSTLPGAMISEPNSQEDLIHMDQVSANFPYFTPTTSASSSPQTSAPSIEILSTTPLTNPSSASSSPPSTTHESPSPLPNYPSNHSFTPIMMSLPYGAPATSFNVHQDTEHLLAWLEDSFPQQTAAVK